MNIRELAEKNEEAKDELEEILKNLWAAKEHFISVGYFDGWGFKQVYNNGGGEGGGEDVTRVYLITYPDKHTEYWKIEISYYSYDGTNWDYWFTDFCQVECKKIMIDSWEPV